MPKGSIARGTMRTTLALGLYLLVQAGTLLLVAGMLGPNRFGAFAGVAALAVLLGTFATFGTHIVLLGEVAKDASQRGEVLAYAIPTTLAFGTLLLGVFFAISLLALRIPGISLSVLLAIGATELLLQPLFTLTVYEHHGLGRIARSQLLRTLPLMLRLVAAGCIVLAHPADPLNAYATVYPLISLAALVLAIRTFPAAWPSPKQWRAPRMAEFRSTVGYAALAITASGPGELDKTLAAKLLPLASAGIYAVGTRIIVASTLPVNAMMSAALPRLFREGRHRPAHTRRLLLWILAAGAAYASLVATILWLTTPLFDWLFGAQYKGLGQNIRWLCIVVPGLTLRMIAGTTMMALGKPWTRVGFELAGLAVLIVAAIVLSARYGTLGMALALACSEWTMAAVGIAVILRQTAPTLEG
ncbi:MAG: lipopolysaccharide biosynthesis protein [Rhodanobacter sp.]|nr:MAG: lipopolysaccharide biosynthesis protein [Rhodanobacter sp.]TAM08883.1 MAG: lipopolysaccharide biosynthesis protein [Rhodanobacter sp.]TAM36925.1 MAG: lipopolysaccharide biosynthesis protein [Rhodanobacter sp.]